MKISKSEEFHFGDSSCVVRKLVILRSMRNELVILHTQKTFPSFLNLALVSDFAWFVTHLPWNHLLRIAHKKFPKF